MPPMGVEPNASCLPDEAIYNLLLANYHSRKHVTLHMIVMSKFPVMKTIP